MSDPTYRIDVEHRPGEGWPWVGVVVRLSDEKEIANSVSESRERLIRELAERIVAQNTKQPSLSIYVDDDGRPVDGHSVKV